MSFYLSGGFYGGGTEHPPSFFHACLCSSGYEYMLDLRGCFSSLYRKTLEKMIYAVAVATFLSGLVQVFIHFPVLRRKELYYRPVLRISDPGLKLVFARMGPVVFGLAVVQINVLIDSIIAVGFSAPQGGSGYFHFAGMAIHYPMKAGAASVLYYSDRLIQFPWVSLVLRWQRPYFHSSLPMPYVRIGATFRPPLTGR